MQTNKLLEEKWQTQRLMAQEAGYSIKKMMDNADKVIEELSQKEGFHFHYGVPEVVKESEK